MQLISLPDYVVQNGTHIIVAIKGTNPSSLASWANDLGFAFTTPSSTWFPGSPGKLHDGFYDAFSDLRADVLAGVQKGINAGITKIHVVGHSLGAALGNIASVYLQKTFPSATVTARLFAPPRVGNPTWADYVDATLGTRSQFMVVADDLVPHLPTLALYYRHSGNEVWMPSTSSPTVWRSCTGQENENCSDSVSDDGDAKISDNHQGPYAGVTMSC
jgi:predicted lipase